MPARARARHVTHAAVVALASSSALSFSLTLYISLFLWNALWTWQLSLLNILALSLPLSSVKGSSARFYPSLSLQLLLCIVSLFLAMSFISLSFFFVSPCGSFAADSSLSSLNLKEFLCSISLPFLQFSCCLFSRSLSFPITSSFSFSLHQFLLLLLLPRSPSFSLFSHTMSLPFLFCVSHLSPFLIQSFYSLFSLASRKFWSGTGHWHPGSLLWQPRKCLLSPFDVTTTSALALVEACPLPPPLPLPTHLSHPTDASHFCRNI